MAKSSKTRRRRFVYGGGGCAYLMVCSAFAAVLLIANSFAINILYPSNESTEWDLFRDPRFRQTVMFLGPVLLLVVQWWTIDLLVDLWTIKYRSKK